jgi:hypothetical protein
VGDAPDRVVGHLASQRDTGDAADPAHVGYVDHVL